ncbi:MAG TPA: valine--tRNA ligase [Candidatus Saccharimonadales bacterium]|nr:valine--tRNA ligase [Candidatus Saccharimonadales bacterium]
MKLPKVYEPSQYEGDIYALWEKSQAFQPRKAGKSFSVVVPPPNANGNLHIGHALTLAIEDIAVRYHRLRGEAALLLPGADHAGFETQVVYERELAKQGKSRFDFSREELYRQVWDFVASNRANYESQFRQLGAGVDWSRFTFTLDEKIVKRAYATFKKMWDEGLIYRGERLVNFCTFHGTAFADIEVEYKEVTGKLWYIRYPLTDGSGEIVVATTRPETMLGDTAVAVHKDDARYTAFHGKTVTLPLTEREVPIIADDSFVDPGFGTGAVKITPAHDPNDYAFGQAHSLPMISVIDHEGKITEEGGPAYRGLTTTEARKQVVADLEKQGYLVKTEELTHNVGHCYKCGNVIEPLLRDQWFVDMQPLAKSAITALQENRIVFYPASKKEQLIAYLQNLRDWNISRQIAWGIPIPAFQNVDDPDDWIYDERVDQELIEIAGKTYHRDPDVFDTWFSSSSWPYATLNYGDKDTDDFNQFYPLSMMETGFDILYPWVSRMLMLGLYITGDVPFKTVYLHGLVLDERGQKMSKSKGNVVNPMDIVTKYGSDALRMGIISGQSAGNNQPFGLPKVVGARNFCNKLWNIARYIEDKLGDQTDRTSVELKTNADHWVLHNLQQTVDGIARDLESYRFAEAYDRLYHFVWDDFADWYIEASKAQSNEGLLALALESILKVAHPFAPFVTETIWQTLAWEEDSTLATSNWPTLPKADKKQAAEFEAIKQIVAESRTILKTLGLRTASMYYTNVPFLAANAPLVQRLARLGDIREVRDGEGLRLTSTPYRCWLDIDQATARNYLKQLEAKHTEVEADIKQLEGRLENKGYVDHAPARIVEQTRAQLTEAQQRLKSIHEEQAKFSSL